MNVGETTTLDDEQIAVACAIVDVLIKFKVRPEAAIHIMTTMATDFRMAIAASAAGRSGTC